MLLHQVGPPRTWARMPRLLIVVALALPSLARAATWNLDPAHTSVQFSVRHPLANTVDGAFATLNRPRAAAETGGVAVGDEVTSTIDVEATKQTAAGG